MQADIFSVTAKAISFEGFEDIVVSVTVTYKGEEFTEEQPVKVPIFISHGNVILETLAHEAFWKMRKHWKRINELPLPEPVVMKEVVYEKEVYPEPTASSDSQCNPDTYE